MDRYVNALLLKFDGTKEDLSDAPSKGEVAATWAVVTGALILILR